MGTKRWSRAGLILVGLYVLLLVWAWIYAKTCTGTYCGMMVLLPVIPWIMLADRFLTEKFMMVSYIVMILLNIGLIYLIGCGFTRVGQWISRSLNKSRE